MQTNCTFIDSNIVIHLQILIFVDIVFETQCSMLLLCISNLTKFIK